MTIAVVLKHIGILQEDIFRSEARPSAEEIISRLDRIAQLVRSLDAPAPPAVVDPPKRGRPRKTVTES